MTIKVQGYCPMGCGPTLELFKDGHVGCNSFDCPRVNAADLILHDAETMHIARVTELDFSIKHPLRERIDDELLTCEIMANMYSFDDPPEPGTYRAWMHEGAIQLEPM